MTDEAKFAHLKKLCSTDEWRAALMAPFLCVSDGVAWSMASNGYFLFAWRGGLDGVEERKDAPKIPQDWISKALASSSPFDAGILRAWAGPVSLAAMKDCSACKGTGVAYVRHDCNCEYCEADDETEVDCVDCDGEGEFKEQVVREGVIGTAVVNRNFFAMLLEGIDGTVRVDVGTDKYDHVRLCGDDWFALVMPLHRDLVERDRVEAAPVLALT